MFSSSRSFSLFFFFFNPWFFFSQDFDAGAGTYVVDDVIFSSLVGEKRILDSSEGVAKKRVVVSHDGVSGYSLVPQVGDIVLARVTKVNSRYARCQLVALGETPLPKDRGAFGGIIRVQDIRENQLNEVQIYKSFRPGDIVRAQVLSLGEKKYLYLSTQRNDLGVVGARCAISGVPMVPASWETMKCPLTDTVEFRKVAKVV